MVEWHQKKPACTQTTLHNYIQTSRTFSVVIPPRPACSSNPGVLYTSLGSVNAQVPWFQPPALAGVDSKASCN